MQNQEMPNKFHLNLELMLTYNCNFRCSYCYEKSCDYKNLDITEETIQKTLQYIDWYLSLDIRNMITICFWGGEPSIKHDVIDKIVTYYLKNRRVDFLIFTNGFMIDPIIEIAKKAAGRFKTQISYDFFGQKRRILAGNKPSKEKILESIQKASLSGIPYKLKSTILFEDLPYIDKFFDEFVFLQKKMQSHDPIDLTLTVDTTATWVKSDDEFKETLQKFKTSLKTVLKTALTENIFEFNWFQHNRALCYAGKTFFCVDIDGKIYTCHGSIFAKDKTDHLLGSIDQLKEIDLPFQLEQPEECRNCDARVCFRCNIHSYERSKKSNFKDRWTDFASSPRYCQVQREISKFSYAFEQIMNKKRLNCGKS